jgi:hypothetical protein
MAEQIAASEPELRRRQSSLRGPRKMRKGVLVRLRNRAAGPPIAASRMLPR